MSLLLDGRLEFILEKYAYKDIDYYYGGLRLLVCFGYNEVNCMIRDNHREFGDVV